MDACVLINLYNGEIVPSVGQLQEFTLLYSSEVQEEVGEVLVENFRQLLGTRSVCFSKQTPAFATTVRIAREYRLGIGESDTIALADELAAQVLSDDRRARRVAKRLLGPTRVSGSIGVLKSLVKNRLLTDVAAHAAYSRMLEGGAFLPTLEVGFFDRTSPHTG